MAIDVYLTFETWSFCVKSDFRFRLLQQNELTIIVTIGNARQISVRKYIYVLSI